MFDFTSLPETLGDLWEWFSEILGGIISHIDTALVSMLEVITQINDVNIDGNTTINLFLGNMRYLIGDGIYVLLMTVLQISFGVAVWNITFQIKEAVLAAWKNRMKIRGSL